MSDKRTYPSAVPTAVDLALARPGDVCHLRTGYTIPFEGNRTDGDGTYPFLAGGDSYQRNGRYIDDETDAPDDIIAVFDQRDGRLICGVERTVADGRT